MKIAKQEAVAHINSILLRHDIITEFGKTTEINDADNAELEMLYANALRRLCPFQNPYSLEFIRNNRADARCSRLDSYKGIFRALLADYENDRMQHYEHFLRQELFGDFLVMATHLIEDEKLKDAAAVFAGGVLEEHLRNLCEKNKITLSERPKLDIMNSDLVKNGVYNKTMQKAVTLWAGIRNDAAHAKYDQYTAAQVEQMISGIQQFVATYPA